jgi:hypothetical protein
MDVCGVVGGKTLMLFCLVDHVIAKPRSLVL